MTTFTTLQRKPLKELNPDFATKIRTSFEHNGFKKLGGELVEIRLGYVEAHLPFSEYVQQQHGLFHGAIVAMAADVASGFAVYTALPPEEECVSAEFKVNFLYPALGDKLISRGSVIKVGRTLVIAEATVSIVRDGEERDCALMLQTCSRVKHLRST